MTKSDGWQSRFGRAGEEYAARWLSARGVVILARRYRAGGGELDLVVREGQYLVFVEVKARSRDGLASPLAAVGPRKRRRLVRAARAFARDNDLRGVAMRFDVVGLSSGGGRLQVEWIRDAFRA